MTLNWQDALVGFIVIAAVAWLVGDRVRRRRAKAGCAGCALAEAVSNPVPPEQ